jgi:iron complex outermembrane receptor protein
MINDFELERDADFRSVDGDPDIGLPTSSEKGAPIDVGDPAMNDVTTITLDYRNTQWLGGSFIAQLYHQDYAALFEGGFFGNFFRLTPDGEPFLDQSQVESEKLGLKLTQSWPDVGGITGLSPTIGLDFQQDQTAQVLTQSGREWVPETTLNSIAPFVQLDYDITEQLRVTGGLRHESAELEVDDYVTIAAANSTAVDGGNPDYTDTLKNLGLAFDISEQITVYGALSDGFTMPDVGRVLRGINTPGQDVDTLIDLEPVVTENQELGVDIDTGNARLHIAWYRSDTDLGSRLERDENDIFHVRREKTEIEGWEIAGDIDITDTAKAGFNYTKIKGRIDSDDDGKLDTDLDGLNIAPDRLNLFGEMLLTNNVLGRLQIAHLFNRDFDNADPEDPGFTFDGFTTADLFLSAGSRFGDISLGIENLLDKQYITYFSQAQASQRANSYFAGPGRTITLAWQMDF